MFIVTAVVSFLEHRYLRLVQVCLGVSAVLCIPLVIVVALALSESPAEA